MFYNIITPQGYIATYSIANPYIVKDPLYKPTEDGKYFYMSRKYYPVSKCYVSIITPRKLEDLFNIAQSFDPYNCEISKFLKAFPTYNAFIKYLKNIKVDHQLISKAPGFDEHFRRVIVKDGQITHYSFDPRYEFLHNMANIIQNKHRFPLKKSPDMLIDVTCILLYNGIL